MPRMMKKKCVRRFPVHCRFATQDSEKNYGLIMKVEEYECIRLIDYMACTQEECARRMQVSRATVQTLYAEARKKLARFLVEGLELQIEGGDYMLVGSDPVKERSQMRIAVTYENGQVFQHFGHTEQFKVYDVEEGKVVNSEVVDTNGQGHGALAGFLARSGVDVLICGGIGGGARNALAEAGIQLFPGAQGDADAQVASYLAGSLEYDPDTMCSHHGEGHGHGHHGDCGGHGHDGCGHQCG